MAAPHLHRLAAPGPLLARLAHGAVQTIFARALHLVRHDPPRTTLRLREAVARRGLAPSRQLLHASTRRARRARLEGRRTPLARGRRPAQPGLPTPCVGSAPALVCSPRSGPSAPPPRSSPPSPSTKPEGLPCRST